MGLIPTALTIAGSDSGGGAGIQADLKTFAAFGVYGTSAITAVTAQNTQAVVAWEPVSPALVVAQIEAVAADIDIHAVKTGMLATPALVEAVANTIAARAFPAVVVDPVMVAKSGDRLLQDAAIDVMKRFLLPRAMVVTPNLPEAEVLSGLTIRTRDDMRAAAVAIYALGAQAVVVKGGHSGGDEIVDLLYDGATFTEFSIARVPTRNTHGTGCTFASAIAASLARGRTLPDAVARAQAYVADAARHALAVGHGHGPLGHFRGGILNE
ncbi:MAG: bifunctional hydroxymethylpyrimidine kinase/phosphomethylpyrimidine kinase [Acidobacteriaceae bacterium]|jgi:hydroxymethylpyrimidine/phosphomethylpyrimidine kinase|nr:bifunctional hydroxymethylpyrimidine kinase/phosphomethylpyrimidine kinase [Acidobacteriaceae bacterium]